MGWGEEGCGVVGGDLISRGCKVRRWIGSEVGEFGGGTRNNGCECGWGTRLAGRFGRVCAGRMAMGRMGG